MMKHCHQTQVHAANPGHWLAHYPAEVGFWIPVVSAQPWQVSPAKTSSDKGNISGCILALTRIFFT